MKQFLLGFAFLSGLVVLAGCQCSGVADRYSDVIDDVGDSGPKLDFLYTPCLDLSRIGKPDWCCCRFSGWFCRRACRDGGWNAAHQSPCPDCGQFHGGGWPISTEGGSIESAPHQPDGVHGETIPVPVMPPSEIPPAPGTPPAPKAAPPAEPAFFLDL